ncbi:ribonuclease P protein component [Arcanobacterium wilhelmae]|uniref:Ribonuclease P protein component n=1 Tax=Arcanobacterium wilhelmae TaxID=1803177 RepID=A0ABT9NB20_9ACTO|nr:ribonuclease P protein component [Arcanobacterium wilhelmae]MDP9800915.1 ribonuclease P protein component [Arcanobacterium wilhelmae]WFN90278.1 ribonuclease P protein component [Arcanobacterium wilhelmae]
MLSAANRMRKSEEFAQTIRGGVRKGNKLLVCHVVASENTKEADRKVGFVVAKTVGNSVVRHRVYRRLRHIMRPLIPSLSASSVVVRAHPSAATASSAELRCAVVKSLIKAGVLPASFFAPEKEALTAQPASDVTPTPASGTASELGACRTPASAENASVNATERQ